MDRSVDFYAFDIVDTGGLQAKAEESGCPELFKKEEVREYVHSIEQVERFRLDNEQSGEEIINVLSHCSFL